MSECVGLAPDVQEGKELRNEAMSERKACGVDSCSKRSMSATANPSQQVHTSRAWNKELRGPFVTLEPHAHGWGLEV